MRRGVVGVGEEEEEEEGKEFRTLFRSFSRIKKKSSKKTRFYSEKVNYFGFSLETPKLTFFLLSATESS